MVIIVLDENLQHSCTTATKDYNFEYSELLLNVRLFSKCPQMHFTMFPSAFDQHLNMEYWKYGNWPIEFIATQEKDQLRHI